MSTDTRAKLLEAAAHLISASPGTSVSLRAICDRVGVQLPTLYHFFGSREGLEDAATVFVFERYLTHNAEETEGVDPLGRLRKWWDVQVGFGLENPAFFRLMYGNDYGHRSAAADQAHAAILALTTSAAASGMLVVDPGPAADHLSATCVGATEFLITEPVPDLTLSDAIRDGVLSAISTARTPATSDSPLQAHTRSLLAALSISTPPSSLRQEEVALLTLWLSRLSSDLEDVRETVS